MSGGVDSSSVASVIRHLDKKGIVPRCVRPILYSYVSSRFSDADEREYLEELLSYCSRWPSRLLNNNDMWSLKDCDQDYGFCPDEPETWLERRPSLDLYKRASLDGCRVVLTGYGGDQILDGDARDLRLAVSSDELFHASRTV